MARPRSGHTTQYFEMFGNRAIYHDGWLARTIHRAPWQTKQAEVLSRATIPGISTMSVEDFSLTEESRLCEEPKRLRMI